MEAARRIVESDFFDTNTNLSYKCLSAPSSTNLKLRAPHFLSEQSKRVSPSPKFQNGSRRANCERRFPFAITRAMLRAESELKCLFLAPTTSPHRALLKQPEKRIPRLLFFTPPLHATKPLQTSHWQLRSSISYQFGKCDFISSP
jgi:hypothetical protein